MIKEVEGRKGQILVSNPGKQYVHQLLLALERKGYDFRFFTSFWYKPGQFPFNLISILPGKFRQKLEGQFRKRYFNKLDGKYVHQFPYFEILRELSDKIFGQSLSERMQYYRDRLHDRWVASRIQSRYSLIIGYEESSLLSFRKGKKKDAITVLDLAQIHYKAIETIGLNYPVFNELYKNKKLRDKINKIKKEELSLADYVICLSDFAKETLVQQGFRSEKIFTVNLGFDPDKFLPKANYSTEGKLKVVFVGTLTRRKGIDVILKACEQLSAYLELTLVGPMADAEDLFQSYKGQLTIYPYLEQKDLNSLLNASDLFVFPSYLDSWGMVVIEAMACGLPVIVSDNTGAKEAVSGQTGFVIPAGDPEALKEKIMYFYTNRDALRTMGQQARAASLSYTWSTYYERIGHIIHKIKDLNEQA